MAGVTTLDVLPRTEPIPLSIVREVGLPPERVQDSVADPPEVIVEVEETKVLIMGAWTAAGVTVTVTCLVSEPLLFVAVMV